MATLFKGQHVPFLVMEVYRILAGSEHPQRNKSKAGSSKKKLEEISRNFTPQPTPPRHVSVMSRMLCRPLLGTLSAQQIERPLLLKGECVCVCFLPIYSGHQVRWTYQPGSRRRKITLDFSSTFLLRCVPLFFSREGFNHSFPSSTVRSNFVF